MFVLTCTYMSCKDMYTNFWMRWEVLKSEPPQDDVPVVALQSFLAMAGAPTLF